MPVENNSISGTICFVWKQIKVDLLQCVAHSRETRLSNPRHCAGSLLLDYVFYELKHKALLMTDEAPIVTKLLTL